MNVRRFAFGATAAIMTSMALIVGLGSANSGRMSIIAGLLIIGVADNLSDTLGIHVHEECDVRGGSAFSLSASNYVTRLLVVLSFVLLVLVFPLEVARIVSLAWGVVVLSVLTFFIAKGRAVSPVKEILKHLLVAATVIVLSQIVGTLMTRVF
jgi:VIT1/CCC1 family predicted Fe2+/Mn2+ transporter